MVNISNKQYKFMCQPFNNTITTSSKQDQ